MRLDGKVALVTGSSQGIGQVIAIRLAEAGAKVVINYRSHPEGAAETVAKIRAMGGECHGAEGYCDDDHAFSIGADLSILADIHRLVGESIDHYGQLDILVNNAGIEKHAPFWEVTEKAFDAVINVNLKGVFFTTQAVVKHLMATERSGKIINISSVHEDLPFPNFAPYCASKGGLKMLTRDLAVELAPYGITVNNVAPGAIETPINSELLNNQAKLNALLKNIPLGRLGHPQDVAGLVEFLASDDANYITGSTFFVDGGLTWNYQEQ
ncbi:glucose 1 dehydrogenase [Halomicronema hongdechloris C2206]|uniref:Glucose 1 dehydrogenase n=1 Tax=Halomicronema hongdechloris C2206 TaxID=1641165 RepID=A0A1Z3HLN9_9CYAN|nr:glucose 1-dehydrogenase [Halomicronema hongdechloris]ASC71221.1 glucose 1 dehydrogenase [Halomicronema hongdechloris C2206]